MTASASTDADLIAAVREQLAEADDAEAAAIASAISTHLADRQRAAAAAAAAAATDAEPNWEGRRWAYAGRVERTGRRCRTVPDDAPVNPWRASERSDRF